MKKLLLLLLIVPIVSCSSDDDANDLNEPLIGTWRESRGQINGENLYITWVFRANGTYENDGQTSDYGPGVWRRMTSEVRFPAYEIARSNCSNTGNECLDGYSNSYGDFLIYLNNNENGLGRINGWNESTGEYYDPLDITIENGGSTIEKVI
ncbi:MAG: hypothetical protein P8O90_06150 [Flavobacteriaceae bacterium]|nr:hypothetical protein [Flavobacteriaceae bacterium]